VFVPWFGWHWVHAYSRPWGIPVAVREPTCAWWASGSIAPAVPEPWQLEQVATAARLYQPSGLAPVTGVGSR